MGPMEPAPSRSHAPVVALLIGVLPLLYVFSIGPVAKTVDLLGLPREPAKAFYAPVIWLHDHTPLKKPLEWYLAVWGLH